MKILVTGATGFAGQHFVNHLLAYTSLKIYTVQRLNQVIQHPNLKVLYHDFNAEFPQWMVDELGEVDYIVHMGAEVQGFKSLTDPQKFVCASVVGTFNMLELARKVKPKKFLYVSSAEAVGSVTDGSSLDETARLKPSNPYAAGKAAAEMLCLAWRDSYGVPVSIIRTMNIFGEGQKADKFVPMVSKKILAGDPVTMHVDAQGNSGSRHWLHVGEFVRALMWLLDKGKPETYHVVGQEKSNAEIIERIGLAIGVPFRINTIVPGASHDMRYSIVDTKLSKEAYWPDRVNADLESTVKWYVANPGEL